MGLLFLYCIISWFTHSYFPSVGVLSLCLYVLPQLLKSVIIHNSQQIGQRVCE